MTDLSHQANQNPTQNPNQGNRRQQNNRNRPNNGANGGNANNAQRNVPTTPGGPGGPASPGGPARSPRPGGITQEQKRQIAERRPESFQISSDGTDDLIVSGGVSEDLQHLASIILRPGSFPLEDQKRMRRFVNSCLMNLSNHHNVDTSGLLLGLASSTGIARMKDIMLHPMSVDAGTAKSPISFQYVVLPFVGLLTREKVCQTTMVEQSNTIYTTVYIHAEKFILNGVLRCTDELLARRSLNDVRISPDRMRIEDPDVCIVTSFPHALLAITRLLFQLLTRVRQARFEFGDIVAKLQLQAEQCGNLPPDVAGTAFERAVLAHEIDRVRAIIMDAMGIPVCVDDRAAANRPSTRRRLHEAGPNIEYLERIYDPPGLLSKDGPRHDNDHSEIADIQVIPTQGEVTSSRDPFLPANGAPNAPHFIDAGWKRQLDIHFRLFREDMLDPLKKGISAFLRLLVKTSKSKQRTLLQQGKLRKMVDENVDLNVYGDVHFHGLRFTRQQRVSVQISFAQPRSLAGQATGRRREFWERSKSRLMQGGLVCLLWRTEDTATTNTPFRMVFGVIADRDITQLSADPQQAFITIALTDPSVYLVMLNDYEHDGDDAIQHFMVESPGVFFESYRPILKALQQCTPATLPFGKYLAPTAADEAEPRHEDFVQPPLYTHAPGFNFDLSVLLRNGLACNLVAANPASRTKAIEMLLQHSILDDTQAKALVETLCREVALIRGPPGTGKTKIGVDLMQVLLHNAAKMKCGPILCICYTNHALDQFLEHLLDKGVKGIVRIGAQSKSERLTDHNMETLMRSYDKSYNTRHAIREAKTEWETVSKSLTSIDRALKTGILPWRYLGPYLMDICDSQYTQLHPAAAEQKKDDDGFKVVGAKTGDDTPYYRWVTGADIEYMEMFIEEMRNTGRLVSVSANRYDILTIEELDTEEDPNADPSQPFVEQPRVKTMTVPTTNRPLELLEENGDVWNMSLTERKRLNESWKPPIQGIMLDDMKRLLEESEKIEQKMKNAYDEVRRLILKESTVIGMTTNGAAKFQTLVASVAPRIIVCEEAGEVLESHILATLSASTQHLVLIGDHLQLRPQVATYKLSTDSPVGKNYNLDKSLFERLVTASVHPLPMSHLTTQRRMRPEIADLIRLTLYPDLIDGGAVMNYPNVSGMRKNLFFMDHSHPEDSKDQFGAQSFANSFEVEMVEALVQYLIRNGYNKPGDIAVLTPYLGQFAKLRKALQNSFMLVIDERDQDQLDEMEAKAEEDEGGEKPANRETPKSGVKEISVQKHITLRTIDNYQGEEAKIVIISLVRNARTQDGTAGRGIGFLKSPNRTNVLLSRAQHGMFILGNADLLASNENGMWPQVVNELRDNDRLGPGFPIMCQNHPNTWNVIDVPENFKIIAPHGGCNLPCTYNMDCGHAIRTTRNTSQLNVTGPVPGYTRNANTPARIDAETRVVHVKRSWAISPFPAATSFDKCNAGRHKTRPSSPANRK
ncbi:hypothetical protein BC936DRAFT_141680 [Jimgerdemannia flammicorona]|uniref:P-loop containing nucleoside triphosphate hydrolase protein n=1 Tax=Jimgerdemannia flammicorona TaxID=994334 RepID=A0A433DN31_9FUNG|nr:hypothetical protein BC936DRAFT_141680 [Jimgerdemannia flammicorona]